MSAGPDFTGLCLIGGAAEQEASESRAIKRKEGPEVAEAREGRGSQKNAVDPQSISKFDTGEGQIRQHGDSSIEEDFRGGPVKTDSNVTD